MLAQYLWGRVRERLAGNSSRLTAIEIEVEESLGQSAIYRERL